MGCATHLTYTLIDTNRTNYHASNASRNCMSCFIINNASVLCCNPFSLSLSRDLNSRESPGIRSYTSVRNNSSVHGAVTRDLTVSDENGELLQPCRYSTIWVIRFGFWKEKKNSVRWKSRELRNKSFDFRQSLTYVIRRIRRRGFSFDSFCSRSRVNSSNNTRILHRVVDDNLNFESVRNRIVFFS